MVLCYSFVFVVHMNAILKLPFGANSFVSSNTYPVDGRGCRIHLHLPLGQDSGQWFASFPIFPKKAKPMSETEKVLSCFFKTSSLNLGVTQSCTACTSTKCQVKGRWSESLCKSQMGQVALGPLQENKLYVWIWNSAFSPPFFHSCAFEKAISNFSLFYVLSSMYTIIPPGLRRSFLWFYDKVWFMGSFSDVLFCES